ncbi:MAG: DUF4290 domain-containing protein [Chitinophagales bacterium]|nr:DUF4290 domain-containing protein [Chitinophagales bacterium]
MKQLSLEYNSTREKLSFLEYGRSIQKLVKYAKTVEDREERQRIVEEIVSLINQLNPQSKNLLEYRQKLWRHVLKMANYELDVDIPEGVDTTLDTQENKAAKVPYPQHEFNWRHYGHNIRMMINKALTMEDGPVKQGYVETILSYMKMSYRTWNKEHFVSDDIIISDLASLSNNKLSVQDDHTITITTKNLQPYHNINTFKVSKNRKGSGSNVKNQNQNPNQNRNRPGAKPVMKPKKK